MYIHAEFHVASFSPSGDKRVSQNLKVGLPPPACGGSGPPCSTMPPRVFTPNSILIHSAVFAHWSWVELCDRLTDGRTDTVYVGNNRLHLMHCMHSMQPKITHLQNLQDPLPGFCPRILLYSAWIGTSYRLYCDSDDVDNGLPQDPHHSLVPTRTKILPMPLHPVLHSVTVTLLLVATDEWWRWWGQ